MFEEFLICFVTFSIWHVNQWNHRCIDENFIPDYPNLKGIRKKYSNPLYDSIINRLGN